MTRRILIAILAFLLGALPAIGVAAERHIDVAIATADSSLRPGTTTRVAITMDPERGWHAYWRNPGDSGLPPEATWSLPAGVTISALEHPAPALLELAGLASYVHEGAFTLLADLKVDRSVPVGTTLPIRGKLSWLACSDTLCVPESADLSLDIAAAEKTRASGAATTIRRAEGTLPRAAAAPLRVALADRQWVFALKAPPSLDLSKARLYPHEAGWFDASTPQRVTQSGDEVQIAAAAAAGTPGQSFSGILSDGRISVAVKGSVGSLPEATVMPEAVTTTAPAATAAVSTSSSRGSAPVLSRLVPSGEDAPAIGAALLGALFGGLLLNFMPCVFPILSLKALSLARSGGDQHTARIEGLAYTAGSVLVTLALGGVLVAARAMGQDVGWSFQLQDPRAILVLLILTLAIALNLAGLFEVRGPALASGSTARGGWQGAFGTGALAAVIATPCSGPFMGVALGAALLLPAAAALAVFAGLGLGMALPFLLIAFVPALHRHLPRPGAWMVTFRRVLAIPMLLTAVALAWILGRQSGVDGMALGLMIALLAASGLWWVGVRQHCGKSASLALGPVAAALLAALIIELPASSTHAVSPTVEATSTLVEPFSEARLAALRAEGKPVFVDFTADWCLICQVNERVAIDRPSTREAFAKTGVVTLVGDWTRGDPAITRFLKANGRNSIPYYLFTDADGRLVELPQVLSSATLVAHARAHET